MMAWKTLFWWFHFMVATVALSEVFKASRHLTTGVTDNVMPLLAWMLLLLLSLAALSFDAYNKAQAEGKLARRVWLFEKLQQFRQRENR